MKTALKPGTYVVAVSGGVDSMTLLHLLSQKPGLKLIVAHFDHGIRDDSHLDRKLVQQTANKLNWPFVFHKGRLGPDVSENEAREARYAFLHQVRKASRARGIITAHHQNDVLETAVHNILRGTNRKGLSSLQDTKHVKRPLLHIPKEQIKDYARTNGLVWREDHTNSNTELTRNYIRHRVLPKLTLAQKHDLLLHIRTARQLNAIIDNQLTSLAQFMRVDDDAHKLDRKKFINLPHTISREMIATWLRLNDIRQFDRKLLEQLVVAAKTYTPGKAAHVDRDHYLLIEPNSLTLLARTN